MNTQINLSRQFLLLTSHLCCVPSPTTRAATHGFLFVFLLLVATVAAQPNGNQRNNNPYGVNQNFKPSMAVTIVVLAAAFVFIALFSLYIRRCARDSSVGGAIGGTLRARSRRVARGLDPSVIETFPTFAYSAVKGLKIGKGALECAVCLNEFEDDETLRLLPKCDHVFHPECIDAWLASHSTCPVCRANLIPGSDADDTSSQQFTMATEDSGDVQDVDTALPTESQEHVLIGANEEHSTDSPSQVIDIGEIPVQNRPVRSKSTRPRRFPRSHSTGHSLVQPGENVDRFTLRLPDDVRRQIMNGKMTRSTSCVTFATRQGSVSGSRRGNRFGFGFGFGGAEGSNRGGKSVRFDRGTSTRLDRWSLPFFWRNPSVRASKRGEGSVKKGGEGSVKSPFDCLGTNKAGDSESTRPPV